MSYFEAFEELKKGVPLLDVAEKYVINKSDLLLYFKRDHGISLKTYLYKKDFKDGLGMKDLCKKYKVSRQSINQHLHRNEISMNDIKIEVLKDKYGNHLTPKEIEKLIKMIDEGYPNSHLRFEFGIFDDVVKSFRKINNLAKANKIKKQLQDIKISNAYKTGKYTHYELARKFSRRTTAIRAAIARAEKLSEIK